MRVRGRYAARYDEFERHEKPIQTAPSHIPSIDQYSLVDVANSQFSNVRVGCWPSPEGFERADGGRRWGKLGTSEITAAIIPFRTKAIGTSSMIRFNNFELELFWYTPDPETAAPTSYPKPCSQQECEKHSDICLLDFPVPRNVTRFPKPLFTTKSTQKSWTFRSEDMSSCDGQARAAKWIWEANGHDPVDLYGGVVLRHSGSPFILTCRVRGKASIEIPNSSLRLRVQFSNEQYNPKWWKMMPRDSEEDLAPHVQKLEFLMRRLNLQSFEDSNEPFVSGGHGLQGNSYGNPNVNDGNVIMGNVSGNVFFGCGSHNTLPQSSQ